MGPGFNDLAWFYHNVFKKPAATFCDSYGRATSSAHSAVSGVGKLGLSPAARRTVSAVNAEHPESFVPRYDRARPFSPMLRLRTARIWLPECAYVPAIESFSRSASAVHHGHAWHHVSAIRGGVRGYRGIYAPCLTPTGVAALRRDVESSKQVWSSERVAGDGD